MKNDFENKIDKFIETLNRTNLNAYGWKNHPKRLHSGKYIEGEPFDYCILSRGYSCVFDAKETHDNYWQITEKDIKQAKNLYKCKKAGMDGFFLIYFYKAKTYLRCEVEKVFESKTINIRDCSVFNIDKAIQEGGRVC